MIFFHLSALTRNFFLVIRPITEIQLLRLMWKINAHTKITPLPHLSVVKVWKIVMRWKFPLWTHTRLCNQGCFHSTCANGVGKYGNEKSGRKSVSHVGMKDDNDDDDCRFGWLNEGYGSKEFWTLTHTLMQIVAHRRHHHHH